MILIQEKNKKVKKEVFEEIEFGNLSTLEFSQF